MVKNIKTTQIDDLGDLLAFPVLTREIGTSAPGSGGGGSPSAPGAAPIAQIIENALRNALSWRPRTGDAQGFAAALTQSFTCREVEGRMECRWTPRGSAGVQATLGGVTGAQASLYTQARNTLDQVLPLLDGLRPLQQEADQEDMASLRAIVRSELIELVNELGTLGGPRIARVDQLFRLLTGPLPDDDDAPDSSSPNDVHGQLQLLQERLGLTRSRVNTVDEEQVYTSYLTLKGYLAALRAAWIAQSASFRRDKPKDPEAEGFLGTQLVLISRELAVLSESVRELYFVMDSVFIGPAERATRVLDLSPDEEDMTVTELFGWIDSYVSDEAPRLLQDSGKDGLTAFKATVRHLRRLVELALRTRRNPIFSNQRLYRAVTEILLHLTSALAASERVTHMRIRSVDPDNIKLSEIANSLTIKILGENFSPSLTLRLRFGATDDTLSPSSVAVGPELITASFKGSELCEGCWTVEVINPDLEMAESCLYIGSEEDLLIEGLALEMSGDCVKAKITGDSFTETTRIVFKFKGTGALDPGEILVRSLTRKDRFELNALLDLTHARPGTWEIKAVDCGIESSEKINLLFTIEPCDYPQQTINVTVEPPVVEPPASAVADKESGNEATPPRKPRPGTKS